MPPFNLQKLPRQDGKIAVVTGANSGLGYETTRGLAQLGVHVVMACRNLGKAASAKTRLEAAVPGASLEVLEIDTADLAQVRAFAAAFAREHDRLDLLINNAGIMGTPRRTTVDGFESQLGTNYLGHFALTGLLLARLEAAPAARVVTLSSLEHRRGELRFDDLQLERDYSPFDAYGQSKLACLVFAYELDRRLEARGSGVRSFAAHPGVSPTNNSADRPWYFKAVMPLARVFGQSLAAGAEPTLMAAAHPNARAGAYYGPNGLGGWRGDPEAVPSSDASHDRRDAQRLWAVSEELTGVAYLD